MKRVLIAILMVMWAGNAEAATVYAKGIAGTVYYESGAANCDAVTAADTAGDLEAALNAAGSGGTLYICSGTYSGAMIDAADGLDTTATNQTISAAPGLTYADVILDGTDSAGNVVVVGHSTTTIQNLTIQNSPATGSKSGINVSGGHANIYHNRFRGNYKHVTSNGLNVNFDYNLVEGYTASTNCVTFKDFSNSKTINVRYNIFRPADDAAGGDTTYLMGPRLSLENVATFNIYNNVFAGCNSDCIVTAATATGAINIKNNTFSGVGGSSGKVLTLQAGATTDVSYNYFTTGVGTPATPYANADTAVGNIFSGGPAYIHSSRKGYLLFSVDDYGSNTWAYLYGTDGTNGVIAEFYNRSMKLTWYVPYVSATDHGGVNLGTNLTWAKAHNVEIGFHGYSESDLSLADDTTIFTLSGNASIDRTANTITTAGGTVSSFKSKTLAAIKLELEAAPHSLTVTPSANYNNGATTVSANALGEVLKDSTNSTAVKLKATDISEGYYKSEIADGVALLEAVTGVGAGTIKSFAYPYGGNIAGSKAAVRAYNTGQITSARAVNFLADAGSMLSNLDRYAVDTFTYTDVKTDTTSGDATQDIKTNVNSLCAFLAEEGGIAHIYAHQTSELSAAQWGTILDEALKWQGHGCEVKMSMSEAMTEILAESTDDGDGTLSRAWTDTSDYRLSPGSPAKNAGTPIAGLTTDYLGNPIKGLPDIGAYENQSGGGLFSIFNRTNQFSPHRRLH